MPVAPDHDLDLWNAIKTDSEWAFTVLFDRYWDKLYATAYRHLRNHELSEELVHDIFLSIWTRRKTLEINAFPNFLVKAVRYQLYNQMRTTKLSVIPLDDHQYENFGWETNKGSEQLEEAELLQELYKCLDPLPKRCREIFRLSRINNLSNQEIADQLGISKRTVENQLSISLKHLKIHWGDLVAVAIVSILFR